MKNTVFFPDFKAIIGLGFLLISNFILAQSTTPNTTSQSDFWRKTQIGGGIGLNIGSDYTDISLAPSILYNFNPYISAGVGLQGSYVRVKDSYESYIYGGSLIGLFNPVEQVQLSAELEELRVNNRFPATHLRDNFWNTALFLGAGFRTNNVTVGVRYNVLFNKNDFVYSEAFMPFIRVYF